MDFSKFKTSDWLIAGGGAGMLIFGLFKWVKVDGPFGGSAGGNAFDFFFTGTVPWLLLVGSAVITVLMALGTMKRANPWPLVILAATALGALLVLIRLIFNPIDCGGFDDCGDLFKRGFGLFLSTAAAIVAAVGGFLGFKESGGDLNDLTDMNKIKGAFNQGDSGGGSVPPPPPPPPGNMPPPPPAP